MISNIPCTLLDKEYKSILMLELGHKTALQTIFWVKKNLSEIENKILQYGGVLLRNTAINELSYFELISKIICKKPLKYEGGITPRTKLSNFVYTSTDYNKNKTIPLHNECSYDTSWPEKILFFCLQPPESGGETILADSKKVLQILGKDIVQLFKSQKITYVRHYNEKNGSHWKNAFLCNTPNELIKILKEKKLAYKWDESENKLTTFVTKYGIIPHPENGQDVWFNQVNLFNPHFRAVTLDRSKQEETRIPVRDVYFENGECIKKEILSKITKAYNKCKISFPWQKDDILILDNMLISHGRSPFTGERKIAVSMGNNK